MALAFIGAANADCTVTTPCGEYTYEGVDNVSASASSTNGVGKITVTDADGNVLDTIECEKASVSTSCVATGGDGDGGDGGDKPFDICDVAPDWIKELIGCDE